MFSFTLQNVYALSVMQYTLKNENVNMCIGTGTIVLKTSIWGSKSLVLWPQIVFHGSAVPL